MNRGVPSTSLTINGTNYKCSMLFSAGALVSMTLMATSTGSGPSNSSKLGLPEIVRSLGGQETAPNVVERTTKLIVHFDINETVLVGDDAGGDSREDSLNKILAKSAFVKIPDGSMEMGKSMDDDDTVMPTHWWDGSTIGESEGKVPPLYTGWDWPEGCCPYYRTAFKKRSKQFVHNNHGKPYQALYHEMQRLVAFNHFKNDDLPDILSHLIPALFDTIQSLSERSQPVRFIFRTFGSDLPDIADAVTAFSRGQHPDYPSFVRPHLELPRELLFRGRWKNNGTCYCLLKYDDPETVVASGDAEIVEFLDSLPMCGINDDYEFWAANKWEPWAGKPVWVPSASTWSSAEHHVLLDDNIHNLEHDSIASVRREQDDGTYRFLSGREIQEMQGLHLIRVPTIEPILNRQWFVEQLDRAQAKFAAQYEQQVQDDII